MIFLNEQLDCIRALQGWLLPLPGGVLRVFTFLDSHAYYFLILAFVWVGISWRWGVRLGSLLILSSMLNRAGKMFFDLPRPLHCDPSLGLVEAGKFGFPSGAAQTAVIFGFFLVYGWKSRWAWPIAVLYVLAVSATRVILGVHFPLDLVGGWALGLVAAGVFVLTVRPIERLASQDSLAALNVVLAMALLGLAVLPARFDARLAAVLTGSLGVYFSTRYCLYLPSSRSRRRRIFHGLIAAGGVSLVGFFPHDLYCSVILTAAAALWISLLASPVCKRL